MESNNSEEKFGRKSNKGTVISAVLIVALISLVAFSLYYTGPGSSDSEKTLSLATTTSTHNSGLLDEILPNFEDEYDAVVKVTPVGTGQALELGRRGDVDILLVHAPSSEQEFVDEGYGTKRYLVCYNHFVLVGPQDDPAGIAPASNVSEALQLICESESKFATRGDESGTHKKEKKLWEMAGYDYSEDIDLLDNDWYLSVSAGMGDTLMRAYELQTYTLSDEGTYWAYQGNMDLEIKLKDDPNLLNQYSVIPVDPEKHDHVKYELSMDFVEWITSERVQNMIADFEANGHKLFVPNAD
jgi:tungstate transport system substrate-binding protein